MQTLNFEPPLLEMRQKVDRITVQEDVMICDQAFGNLFCWGKIMDVGLVLSEDTFIARWGKEVTVPIGANRKALLEQMLEDGHSRFLGIDERYKQWMEQTFSGKFTFKEAKNFDYIYDREALSTLKGKKLAAKRNHINAFEQSHQWEVRPIDQSNLQEVMEFNDWWCRQNNCAAEDSMAWEGCAVRRGLKHFEALGFFGVALYADGRLCAFTYGEPLGKEGFCIHAEKADADLRGAYPMINREFAKRLPPHVRWINREDDAGDEGLKKAKMSYRPMLLLKKYEAEYCNE
jgi:hypothetical protein